MASVWIHICMIDFYTYFSSFEEAYYYSKKVCKISTSYLSIIEYLNNHSIATLSYSDNYHLIIYYGKNTPPVSKKLYPNGILFLEKDKLFDLIEF